MPFKIIASEEISHRTDFSILCNARGYKDAVEVGVDQGIFAKDFLSRFNGNWLYGVDLYEPTPDFPHSRYADMLVAINALMPYHGRFRLIVARSVEAAPFVASLIKPEFVYIDAMHEELDVAADLEAWWPVIAEHGIIAGHDFDDSHPGVMAAVSRFAQEHDLIVRLTHEEKMPSWYCYKTEPATVFHRLFRSGESPNPHAPEVPEGR